MNFSKEYDEYLKKSLPELAEIMAGHEELNSKANIARLVYEERQMEKQHQLSMKLLSKELRWNKFSLVINVITILSAVILGWFLKSASSP